jgi:hypothetical protein
MKLPSLGLDYQEDRILLPQLKQERRRACQWVHLETGKILQRTFYQYTFENQLKVKTFQGEPPYWNGIVYDKPETYTNPVEINHYYLVRLKYEVRELEGYLSYGIPILNKSEISPQVKLSTDPDRLNEFKGWLERIGTFEAYDYYVPLETGEEFVWDAAILQLNITRPLTGLDKVGGDDTPTLEELVLTKTEALREAKYENIEFRVTTSAGIENPVPTGGVITATKNYFATGGVNTVTQSLGENQIVFKFQNLGVSGLGFNLTYLNCNAWLSQDGISLTRKITPNVSLQSGVDDSLISAEIQVSKDLQYLIIQPLYPLRENINPGYNSVKAHQAAANGTAYHVPRLLYPPLVPNWLGLNQRFYIKLRYTGVHYIPYKNEPISTSDKQIVGEGLTDLNNPKPQGINVDCNFETNETDWRIIPVT